ncbi:hypothetical protein GCM10027073_26380 [Streptomyces chlorus]
MLAGSSSFSGSMAVLFPLVPAWPAGCSRFGRDAPDAQRKSKPESTDENRTRAALVQVSGPIEPFRAFTSQVKIDYPPKDWLTWEDTVCPP